MMLCKHSKSTSLF